MDYSLLLGIELIGLKNREDANGVHSLVGQDSIKTSNDSLGI